MSTPLSARCLLQSLDKLVPAGGSEFSASAESREYGLPMRQATFARLHQAVDWWPICTSQFSLLRSWVQNGVDKIARMSGAGIALKLLDFLAVVVVGRAATAAAGVVAAFAMDDVAAADALSLAGSFSILS